MAETTLGYTSLAENGTGNHTVPPHGGYFGSSLDLTSILMSTVYTLIFLVGLVGNVLVIFVVTKYAKMKTVTNLYILNLSVTDFIFLMGLPLVITNTIVKTWVFGGVMCKIYWAQTCINLLTGPFTLTMMGADRYFAVCHPITSMNYRTPRNAYIILACIWAVSLVAMSPVVWYAQLVTSPINPGHNTCNVHWPEGQKGAGYQAFTIYTLMLGFAFPMLLIILFYTLLVCRLRLKRAHLASTDKRRSSHRKVTKLVTLIILLFVVCWLPYYAFQIEILVNPVKTLPLWKIYLFYAFNLLSYANSVLNPVMYAFTNDAFRDSFIGAFTCSKDPMLLHARRTSEYVSNCNSHADPSAAPHAGKGRRTFHLPPDGTYVQAQEMTTLPVSGNGHVDIQDEKKDGHPEQTAV